jgi:hypothetical protein
MDGDMDGGHGRGERHRWVYDRLVLYILYTLYIGRSDWIGLHLTIILVKDSRENHPISFGKGLDWTGLDWIGQGNSLTDTAVAALAAAVMSEF